MWHFPGMRVSWFCNTTGTTLITKKFGRFYFGTKKMCENLIAIPDDFGLFFGRNRRQFQRIRGIFEMSENLMRE